MIQIYKYIYSFQIKDDFRFMRPMLEHRRPWSHTFQQFLQDYTHSYGHTHFKNVMTYRFTFLH